MDDGNHREAGRQRTRVGRGGEGADGVESKREGRNEKYISTKSWERYGQG